MFIYYFIFYMKVTNKASNQLGRSLCHYVNISRGTHVLPHMHTKSLSKSLLLSGTPFPPLLAGLGPAAHPYLGRSFPVTSIHPRC